MKNLTLILPGMALLSACHSRPPITDPGLVRYPYKIDTSYQWDINPDPKNALIVLRALKAEELGDTADFKKYFADSLVINADSMHFAGSLAEMKKMMQLRTDSASDMKIAVEDWQSVINKSKTEEWVTTWYTQSWTDTHGKRDSIQYSEDVQVKNDKIVRINEFSRHFPKPNK
ncbi:hypothetical protein [Mucilaginibacter agri]|uniref:Nuclear transport factor 2 family protein n=1 Tax=Mucilaginibacter agri TaxID=2695265 RepID=A0A965ZIV3_9SPHI|nr:hypothetical protein [Mucilaginibacter agri]NCD71480.1 hypothetical protein [Mucilaginibacter agri]